MRPVLLVHLLPLPHSAHETCGIMRALRLGLVFVFVIGLNRYCSLLDGWEVGVVCVQCCVWSEQGLLERGVVYRRQLLLLLLQRGSRTPPLYSSISSTAALKYSRPVLLYRCRLGLSLTCFGQNSICNRCVQCTFIRTILSEGLRCSRRAAMPLESCVLQAHDIYGTRGTRST